MNKKIREERIECPHCGHHIRVTIDVSNGDQDFYDECQACCREIHYKMHIDEYYQSIQLNIDSDDEQIF